MSQFVPKALSKLTRYPVIALPYERNAEAFPREIMVDYDTGGIYAKDEHGNIISLSSSINASSVYIKDANGNIISLETLLNSMVARMLYVKEVNELAIFKIPNVSQFDLKSVILKDNLVQIYNFDQATTNSIPIKNENGVVEWVDKQTLLTDTGMAVSAEGTFTIEDAVIVTERIFSSLTISNALDYDDQSVDNANGNYTATVDNKVWKRVIGEDIYTATYNDLTDEWELEGPVNVKSFSVNTNNTVFNEINLIENKKMQTIVPSGLSIDVYLPRTTGNLTYSKIIWKMQTREVEPTVTWKSVSLGQSIVAADIVWEYAADYDPSPNTNNFYVFETWNGGESWFGKVTRMGRTAFEITQEYLEENYYNKAEIDEITSWDISRV